MSSTINTLPASPSSQGAHSADSPILNQPPTPLSPSRSTPAGSNNAFGNDSQLTSSLGTGGVVRRKPARRANTAERRATHNAVERQRRETLNGRFLDLAALLPNLVSVRRPSKSAIVNSSIALIHTQRRLRALAARELRALNAEANTLRQEVNEWRKVHPSSPVAGGASSTLAEEPARSADFIALIELEDVPEDEMEMNEAERIAYEMRGGEGGMMYGEDGDGDDLGDEDLSDGQRQQVQQQPTPAPSVASQAPRPTRVRGQSFSSPISHNAQTQPTAQPQQHQINQLPAPAAQHSQSMLPAQYRDQHAQLAQHQLIPQQHIGFPGSFLPPSFDAIAAAAGFPSGAPIVEADAAKLAAWNAHIYSALAAQQQQQQVSQQQQQWAAAMQFQTPPNSSQGPPGMFGTTQQQGPSFLAHFQRAPGMTNMFAAGMKGIEEESGASVSSPSSQSFANSTFGNDSQQSSSAAPGSASNTSLSSAPSLGLSGLASVGSSSSTMASPIHLNLGSDPFGTGVNFPYGASTGSNWPNPRSTSSTPGLSGLSHHPQAVSVGGGGGGGNHVSYAMMSMFI